MRRISDRDGARGVPLRVDLHGRTSAQPPLVLVHGFMGSVDSWSALAAHLAHGREVIVPQLPGHGEGAVLADPAECAVERVAERLARLVERLGAAEADWLGYSMGGRIVLAGVAAGVIRPRRLILESASPGLAGAEERAGRRALDEQRARRLETEGMAPFVDDWLRAPLFASLPEGVVAHARAQRLAHRPAALAAALRGGGTGSQPSYWSRLAEIEVPTLLITGGLDRKFVDIARRMAARLPAASRISFEGVGHAVHLEAPERWRSEVEAWLSLPAPRS